VSRIPAQAVTIESFRVRDPKNDYLRTVARVLRGRVVLHVTREFGENDTRGAEDAARMWCAAHAVEVSS
jgi:hypothetical protein